MAHDFFGQPESPPLTNFDVPLPGESEPEAEVLQDSQMEDSFVDETELQKILSSIPESIGCHYFSIPVVEAPSKTRWKGAAPVRHSPTHLQGRSTTNRNRVKRKGPRCSVGPDGWPVVADTYESEPEAAAERVEEHSVEGPITAPPFEPIIGPPYIYIWNGVRIDLSEVNPLVHKLLLEQYSSRGKLPHPTEMKMWPVYYRVYPI